MIATSGRFSHNRRTLPMDEVRHLGAAAGREQTKVVNAATTYVGAEHLLCDHRDAARGCSSTGTRDGNR